MTNITTWVIIIYVCIEVLTLIKVLITPKTKVQYNVYRGFLSDDRRWAIAYWIFNTIVFTGIFGGIFWW